MNAPDDIAGWLKLIVAVGSLIAMLWAGIAFAIEMHDRDIESSLHSIDYELRIQNCQREKRALGQTFEVAQLQCRREESRR